MIREITYFLVVFMFASPLDANVNRALVRSEMRPPKGSFLAANLTARETETVNGVVLRLLSARDANLTNVNLGLDKLIDPSIDEASVRRELDTLTGQARAMLGPNPTDEDKLNAVRRVIYKSGPWNDNRPFAYDHADPLGLNIKNKLLSTYLRTRLGNCVSMPTLFLILADRLGLNVSFALAPLHVFVRYTDPQGRAFNIETTSGANLARPEWYRQNLPMTAARSRAVSICGRSPVRKSWLTWRRP